MIKIHINDCDTLASILFDYGHNGQVTYSRFGNYAIYEFSNSEDELAFRPTYGSVGTLCGEQV